MTDPTQRFTGRALDYSRYRPAYPPELLDLLRRECGLTEDAVVADVGSGTKFEGLLGRLRSSSYVPSDGEPGYREMLDELKRIFCDHENVGRVVMEYDTCAY